MFQAIAGGVFGLLLSIITYFLKLLVQDFKQMSTEMYKLKDSVIRLESEQSLIKKLLQRKSSLQ